MSLDCTRWLPNEALHLSKALLKRVLRTRIVLMPLQVNSGVEVVEKPSTRQPAGPNRVGVRTPTASVVMVVLRVLFGAHRSPEARRCLAITVPHAA